MDGVLIVDKPAGMTSHDVVDFIRRTFGIKKAGHAGTLDPFATGVLVMLLGKLTKESVRLAAVDKEYAARMFLGAASDTGDRTGRIVNSTAALMISLQEIESVFSKFRGEIIQVPPMYSAVKVNGKKMYELARRGVEAERPPRKVTIKSLEITAFTPPITAFEVTCSKGTYIRQLAADIGSALGCGAYLESLRRTRCGDFKIADAVSLDRLKETARDDLVKLLARS